MSSFFAKKWTVVLASAAAMAWGLNSPTSTASESGEDGAKVTCVSWKTEARFSGFAYDHLVHLDNRCAHGAACSVKTDVNPKPQSVSLSAKEKKTVLTFRGSPARTFKAGVSCEKK